VLDRHGAVIGTVVDVFDDCRTGRARWLAVSTGYFGTRRALVPVRGASLLGADVLVAHEMAAVVAAPDVHTYTAIAPSDEAALCAHYGSGGSDSQRSSTSKETQ